MSFDSLKGFPFGLRAISFLQVVSQLITFLLPSNCIHLVTAFSLLDPLVICFEVGNVCFTKTVAEQNSCWDTACLRLHFRWQLNKWLLIMSRDVAQITFYPHLLGFMAWFLTCLLRCCKRTNESLCSGECCKECKRCLYCSRANEMCPDKNQNNAPLYSSVPSTGLNTH